MAALWAPDPPAPVAAASYSKEPLSIGPAEDDLELAFDSGGEIVAFGLSLSRAEAEASACALTERL